MNSSQDPLQEEQQPGPPALPCFYACWIFLSVTTVTIRRAKVARRLRTDHLRPPGCHTRPVSPPLANALSRGRERGSVARAFMARGFSHDQRTAGRKGLRCMRGVSPPDFVGQGSALPGRRSIGSASSPSSCVCYPLSASCSLCAASPGPEGRKILAHVVSRGNQSAL